MAHWRGTVNELRAMEPALQQGVRTFVTVPVRLDPHTDTLLSSFKAAVYVRASMCIAGIVIRLCQSCAGFQQSQGCSPLPTRLGFAFAFEHLH